MCFRMSLEFAWVRKPFPTNVTFKRLLASISANMTLQIAWSHKSLFAYLTFVKSFSGMKSCSQKITKMSKSLFTMVTFVWFFTCVKSSMAFHMIDVVETLRAIITSVWFFSGMHSGVDFQVTGIWKAFVKPLPHVSHYLPECYKKNQLWTDSGLVWL